MRKSHADHFKDGGIIVLLEPDVAKAFPSARSVNAALRRVIRQKKKPAATRQPRRST
jgi:hypothetical protein